METEQSLNYIEKPKNTGDLVNNSKFQLNNVVGFIRAKDYDCALIKARWLVRALELVVAQPDR